MLLGLFNEMRAAKVPVSVRELLDLIDALKHRVVFADMDEFYFLARTVMVKDERHFDKFDRAFGAYFKGLENLDQHLEALIPEDWLRKEFERSLTDEERADPVLGGLDKLIEEFKKRLEEQKERHAGGNKWIGTGGTSPFGSGGYNPEGIRIGDAGKRQGKAVKVWDQREYKNLDDRVELGTRNIKIALRRLRKFARQGAADELDIDGTIDHTARDAGLLNIQMRPERRNAVKLLILFDIGGSMDAHVKVCEELFSACKTEFKHLSTSTSTISSTNRCGRTTSAARRSAPRRWMCCTSTARTTRWCSSVTRRWRPMRSPSRAAASSTGTRKQATCGCSASWRSTRSSSGSTLSQGYLGLHHLHRDRSRAGRRPDVPADPQWARGRMKFWPSERSAPGRRPQSARRWCSAIRPVASRPRAKRETGGQQQALHQRASSNAQLRPQAMASGANRTWKR